MFTLGNFESDVVNSFYLGPYMFPCRQVSRPTGGPLGSGGFSRKNIVVVFYERPGLLCFLC